MLCSIFIRYNSKQLLQIPALFQRRRFVERSVAVFFGFLEVLVSLDNILDQFVPDHIGFGKKHKFDASSIVWLKVGGVSACLNLLKK